MSNVLLIHSSVFGEKSQSLGLARDFLKRYPHRSLVERALAPHTMPHLDGETFAAMGTDAGDLNRRQKELVALSDELIAELEAADTIVLAVPMYNFSIPSTLKAWIDHVARRGRTFRYTEKGPRACSGTRKCSCWWRAAASTARARPMPPSTSRSRISGRCSASLA
jgi:Acyl carrier protein phosphodiesterase